MKALLVAIFLSAVISPHDFFLSILTIRENAAEKTLDLTWRITAHDIEHALENVAPLKLASEKEHPRADSILNAYFHEHLTLRMNGEALDWTWVGKELESENLYCYLQVQGVEHFGDLTVSNSLLQDLYYEQQNIVHLEAPGEVVRSHTFLINAPSFTFARR